MKRAVFMILLALAAKAMAQQVRVTVQVIEVPHGEVTKWTTGGKLLGPEIHERALKLVEGGGAEIVDTNVVVSRSGGRALIGSFAEVIYPTEYEPGGLGEGLNRWETWQPERWVPRPMDFLEFETRNIGTEVEIEPLIDKTGNVVDLRISHEMVDRDSLVTWTEFRDRWGDASIRRPIFNTRRLTNSLTLAPGSFELINVFTPKPAAVPAVATRQLVFVKCDVLPLPK